MAPTHPLFRPDVLLDYPLKPFVLGAHISTGSNRRDRFGEGACMFRIRDKALAYCLRALVIAGFGELYGVTTALRQL